MKVAIVLATYNPKMDYFRMQLESIVQQTHGDWICHLIDDNSDNATEIEALLAEINDSRIVLHSHDQQKNVYHNFERGLSYILQEADYICLADQDDVWKKKKLEVLIDYAKKYPKIDLFHSDADVIDGSGMTISDSLWNYEHRDVRSLSWLDLLLKNVVTGCTTMFKTSLAQISLPFPPQNHIEFHHDLWLSLNASLRGGVYSIPERLISYRMHGQNVIGPEKRDIAKKLLSFLINPRSKSDLDFFKVRKKMMDKIIENRDDLSTLLDDDSWQIYDKPTAAVTLKQLALYCIRDFQKAIYLLQFLKGRKAFKS